MIPAKVYNKRTRRKGNFQACAMVVPSTGVSRRYGAIVARVLVAANTPEVPVRVYNPCDGPVTINKFATLGQLQTPESIRPCPRINDTATLPAEDRATLSVGRVAAEQQPQAVTPTEQPATCPSVASSQAAPGQKPTAATNTDVPAHLAKLYEHSVRQLPDEHKATVAALLRDYSDVFAASSSDVGKTHLVQHIVDTGQEKPIQERVRRFPYEQSKEIEKQVTAMKEQGIIQESNSRWASNVVLVKKKDGTWRMCVDYRRLNAKTKNTDPYMLPRIDETLDRLSKAKFFSTAEWLPPG